MINDMIIILRVVDLLHFFISSDGFDIAFDIFPLNT